MTSDSISRSTYVTLRGSSITPYAYLNSETSRTKSTNNAPDEAVLRKDSTNTDKTSRVGLSQKEVLGPIKRNGNPPSLKAYSSMERNSNGSLEIAKISESAPLHRSESKKSLLHPTVCISKCNLDFISSYKFDSPPRCYITGVIIIIIHPIRKEKGNLTRQHN